MWRQPDVPRPRSEDQRCRVGHRDRSSSRGRAFRQTRRRWTLRWKDRRVRGYRAWRLWHADSGRRRSPGPACAVPSERPRPGVEKRESRALPRRAQPGTQALIKTGPLEVGVVRAEQADDIVELEILDAVEDLLAAE